MFKIKYHLQTMINQWKVENEKVETIKNTEENQDTTFYTFKATLPFNFDADIN